MKMILAFLAGAWVVVACSRVSPEMQVIHDAAEALGGQGRLLQIKTLVIEGRARLPTWDKTSRPIPICPFGK